MITLCVSTRCTLTIPQDRWDCLVFKKWSILSQHHDPNLLKINPFLTATVFAGDHSRSICWTSEWHTEAWEMSPWELHLKIRGFYREAAPSLAKNPPICSGNPELALQPVLTVPAAAASGGTHALTAIARGDRGTCAPRAPPRDQAPQGLNSPGARGFPNHLKLLWYVSHYSLHKQTPVILHDREHAHVTLSWID